jgi:hypothetical protein
LLEQLHPKQAHIYTALNCVDPSFRSKGIAPSILKYVSEISDQLQIPIYAEISNPKSLALWERAGLEIVSKHQIAGTTYWSMLRKPMVKKV